MRSVHKPKVANVSLVESDTIAVQLDDADGEPVTLFLPVSQGSAFMTALGMMMRPFLKGCPEYQARQSEVEKAYERHMASRP